MATITKRMTKSGPTYRIQVKLKDKGSGKMNVYSTTWKPQMGMTPKQIEREVIVYAVNRSLDEDMALEIELQGFEGAHLIEHVELYSDDLGAVNGKDDARVAPRTVAQSGGASVTLKKHSWNMLRYKVGK